MHPVPALYEFVAKFLVVVAASVGVLMASHALRWSPVAGFLLTGILIGPSGLGLVPRQDVELFAEIGVAILLFTVGLEFSLAQVRQNWRPVAVGGGLQVLGTILVTVVLATALRLGMPTAIFLGWAVALSSTAIVFKTYSDRQELQSPQGTLVTGILLFQDFCLAPMIVLTPVLAGAAAASAGGVLARLSFGVLLVAAAFALARLVVPRLLHWIAHTHVREIFLLGALGVCLGMGLLTERLGFSLALGAFLAGLILSESEYSHQVSAEVVPFRDLLGSLFFISLGMLLRFDMLRSSALAVIGVGVGIVVVKSVVAAGVVGFMGYPARTAWITGLSLGQAGEFSFVLAGVGLHLGLLDAALHQVFLGASALTMLFSPLWIGLAPRLAPHLPRPPGPLARLRRPLRGGSPEREPERSGHVILVGYGLNGRNVARVLQETAIPFVVIELDVDLVHAARGAGVPVLYGDATRAELLTASGIRTASMLVLAISDLAATRQAVRTARQLNPKVYVLARTWAVDEVETLLALGADEVIPEEFETSIEIFSRVLARHHVPRNIIDAQVRIIRDAGYGLLRGTPAEGTAALDRIAEILAGTLTETFLVKAGALADGRTLRDLNLRKRTRAAAIAIVREGQAITNPEPDLPIRAQDTLVLVGDHAALEAATQLLEGQAAGTSTGALPSAGT